MRSSRKQRGGTQENQAYRHSPGNDVLPLPDDSVIATDFATAVWQEDGRDHLHSPVPIVSGRCHVHALAVYVLANSISCSENELRLQTSIMLPDHHKTIALQHLSTTTMNGDQKMVRDTGFEPVTPSVSGRCSTTELTAQFRGFPPGGEARGKPTHCATPFFIRVTQKKSSSHREIAA